MHHDQWLNEDYMNSVKREVVTIATALLEDKIEFLKGVRELTRLRFQVCEDNLDSDFILFVAIESQTDHLPTADQHYLAADSWLEKCKLETTNVEKFYREQVTEACSKLITRFSANA